MISTTYFGKSLQDGIVAFVLLVEIVHFHSVKVNTEEGLDGFGKLESKHG